MYAKFTTKNYQGYFYKLLLILFDLTFNLSALCKMWIFRRPPEARPYGMAASRGEPVLFPVEGVGMHSVERNAEFPVLVVGYRTCLTNIRNGWILRGKWLRSRFKIYACVGKNVAYFRCQFRSFYFRQKPICGANNFNLLTVNAQHFIVAVHHHQGQVVAHGSARGFYKPTYFPVI